MALSSNNRIQERRMSRSKSCFRSCFRCLKSESKANSPISKKVAGERSKSTRSARKTVPVGVEALGQNSASELKEEARVTGQSTESSDDRLPDSGRYRKVLSTN